MPPSIVDYSNLGHQTDASWNDKAPAVAPAGSGSDTVLQIYVPAENTIIDYGAGAVPGIRMATDHHAHLTAGTPQTTISLGDTAGPGVAGAAGLNIFTAGAKNEDGVGPTSGTYAAKAEHVSGNWREECNSAKQERVHGSWNQVCDQVMTQSFGTHSHFVEHDSITKIGGNSTNNIIGDFTIDYGGSHTETVQGQQTTNYMSPKLDFHWGLKSSVFLGIDASLNVAAKESIFVGKTHSASLAINASVKLGGDFNYNVGASVTTNQSLSVSTTLIGKSKTMFTINDDGTVTKAAGVEVSKAMAKIVNAVTTVVK